MEAFMRYNTNENTISGNTKSDETSEHSIRDDVINVYNAYENNLKNISVQIPKRRITVCTGVSGSGKSSLCIDTIAASSIKQLNETFPSFVQRYLPKYGSPHVGRIEHLPVAILIDQKKPSTNSRSTVGTYTDVYALFRLLFSRVGEPFVGYSDIFSFNHPLGRCPKCEGLGTITEIDLHKLVDFNKSLNEEGCINYVACKPGGWRWIVYANSGFFDINKKIKDYTPQELELFLYAPQMKKLENPPNNWPKTAKYEGLMIRMYRCINKTDDGIRHKKVLDPMTVTRTCPLCKGKRLNQNILSCKIYGENISDISEMSISETIHWIQKITNPIATDIQSKLHKKLNALNQIGLGYLCLNRGMDTLSGGEAQRCKIAKYINSSLSDVLYVLDEPSIGLHGRDIGLLKESVLRLKEQGNTILIIEHQREIIQMADHIIDMGPGSGQDGGTILFEGSYHELLHSHTLTGKLLSQKKPLKKLFQKPDSWITIKNITYHNLQNLTVSFPIGVLTVIAGVSGSGKSSLMHYFMNAVEKDTIYISQKNIGVSLRSTPATYMKAADEIRKLFAKEYNESPNLFSFNGKGACPVCGGKGIIISEMAFMDSVETPCESCHGLRYSENVLSYRFNGMNIAEVMDLTVDKAIHLFAGTAIAGRLAPLVEVNLGYLHLNQSLSTLSGGELQRIKLASHLNTKNQIFIMDEPTDGLHSGDINKLMGLFQKIIDHGNTVFLIEHSIDILKNADYVIELGPSGGPLGGNILFNGTPLEMLSSNRSITARYLAKELPA